MSKRGSYLAIFAFLITFFNKNYIKFVIFAKNYVDCYINQDISVQKIFCSYLSGLTSRIFSKYSFSWKIYKWHFYRFTFWWRLRICYYSGWNMYMKNEIVKYECILPCNSRHFNNFIGNNCSNYTHTSSFWWALICYKILCDIIHALSCGGSLMVLLHSVDLSSDLIYI
jgi:hypothetical protein